MATEQEILANTLKSQEEGGAAVAGGLLGEGADVPKVLEENPAVKQLLEESIATQSGNIGSVITSDEAQTKTEDNQAALDKIIQGIVDASHASAEAQKPTTTANATITPITDTTTVDPIEAQIDAATAAMESEVNSYLAQLDTYSTTLNEQNQSLIDNIRASYERRMEQMETLNKSTYAAQTLLGTRSGRQRYAAEIQTNILSAEEAAGIQRLTDLENEMNSLILEAESANTAKQFELLDKKMAQISELNNTKIALLKDQQSLALQQEQLNIQKAQEAREATRFDMEQAETTAYNIANSSLSSLVGLDTEASTKKIQELAEQYGVDFNTLNTAVIEARNSQYAENLALSKTNLEIARSLPYGESWTDPATGLTFYGAADPETIDIERVIGGMSYLVRYDVSGSEPKEILVLPQGEKYKTTGTVNTSNLPEGFMDSIEDAVQSLKSGDEWGPVWNRVKAQYPTMDDATIDNLIGEQWKVEGAYDEYKLLTASVPSQQAQSESLIWQYISQNPDIPTEQLKQEIQASGFDPEDFGIY